jgi:hypothetical protein
MGGRGSILSSVARSYHIQMDKKHAEHRKNMSGLGPATCIRAVLSRLIPCRGSRDKKASMVAPLTAGCCGQDSSSAMASSTYLSALQLCRALNSAKVRRGSWGQGMAVEMMGWNIKNEAPYANTRIPALMIRLFFRRIKYAARRQTRK